MQFSNVFLSALAAVGSMAAPTEPRAEAVSMMAQATTWTITSLTRAVNADNTVATWTFGINNGQTTTPCTEVVQGTNASTLSGGPVTCGPYTVTSGWSDQFGPGNEFTTFAVVDYNAQLIVFPSYTDKEVASGNAVTPDKSYTPAKLT
ncbi:putative small secreted protein [Diaporthe ampelina]|uniref:Putative small secreted protein n=1 Tax=Diaporthe ampelina TaxID=1214573 RepID=A0A0G2I4R6_9PEZI|nr:putative small secreted protein [Diaporthe ampelina]